MTKYDIKAFSLGVFFRFFAIIFALVLFAQVVNAQSMNMPNQAANPYFDQGGYAFPSPQGYGMQQGDYGVQQGGYGVQQGGYGVQQGGYGVQQGGYGVQQGGYGVQQGGYGVQQGGYGVQQGGYGVQQGGYGASASAGFSSGQPQGGYGIQQGGYGASASAGFSYGQSPNGREVVRRDTPESSWGALSEGGYEAKSFIKKRRVRSSQGIRDYNQAYYNNLPFPQMPSKRFPLETENWQETLFLEVVGRSISANQAEDVDVFLSGLSSKGRTSLSIELPSTLDTSGADVLVEYIIDQAAHYGIDPNQITVGVQFGSSTSIGGLLSIVATVTKLRTVDCTSRTESINASSGNLQQFSLGCSTYSNLAAMIADPGHIANPVFQRGRPNPLANKGSSDYVGSFIRQ